MHYENDMSQEARSQSHFVDRVLRFIHCRFIWLLFGSYAAAAVFPGPGMSIKNASLGQLTLFHETVSLSLPVLMLSLLLLTASLGVHISHLRALLRAPKALTAGLLAKLLVPVAFIFLVSQTMHLWPQPDQVQSILVGLAVVASMPIAGSSTAWSRHGNGDLALSLSLVLFSTFISPVTAPVTMHLIDLMAAPNCAEDLHRLATSGTGRFLAFSVVVPTVLGIACHTALGEKRILTVTPGLKLVNVLILLLLNYSNASSSLPQVVANPDWPFLFVTLGIVVSMCVTGFAVGWWLGRLVKADLSKRMSLMFGLGMSNNGTGLVLASIALANHPRVLLPIIFYNLIQHLVAAGTVALVSHRADNRAASPPAAAPKAEAVRV